MLFYIVTQKQLNIQRTVENGIHTEIIDVLHCVYGARRILLLYKT